MKTTLRIIILIVNILAFAGSIFWMIKKPDYDSVISTLVLFASLIGLLITAPKEKGNQKQSQKSGNRSTNLQAGRDINISNK